MLRLIAILLVLMPTLAWAGEFMNTTVTFVAADDNVFVDAGETIPSSPRPDFRPRPGNSLFFDNYDTRDTGEQTRTYLVAYKEFEGLIDGWTPEAAMVLKWDENRLATNIGRYDDTGYRTNYGGIKDDGSYLALHYGELKGGRWSMVLFPVDSDRFRLGYSWELTWGGRSAFILAKTVPGVKLSYDSEGFYAFVGAKSARTQTFTAGEYDQDRDQHEPVYAALGGAGLRLSPNLLVETNGGWFERGNIPTDRVGAQGETLNLWGTSAQVTWHDGISPRRSSDTKLLRNTGEGPRIYGFDDRSRGYLISAEATVTSQTLEDSDALGSVKRELGYAGDLNVRFQQGPWAANADFVLRSLSFLVQETPGIFPFATIPGDLETAPEFFLTAGVDYQIPRYKLVPGFSVGMQRPAHTTATPINSDGQTGEPSQVLFRRIKDVTGHSTLEYIPLPTSQEIKPIYSGRAHLASHLSEMMTVVFDVKLSHNANLARLDVDSGIKDFEDPWILGFSLLAQAKF